MWYNDSYRTIVCSAAASDVTALPVTYVKFIVQYLGCVYVCSVANHVPMCIHPYVKVGSLLNYDMTHYLGSVHSLSDCFYSPNCTLASSYLFCPDKKFKCFLG